MQLARNDLRVNLWGHERAHVERLQAQRENSEYLPGFALASNIHPEHDLQARSRDCRFVLVAIPSKGFRSLLQQLETDARATMSPYSGRARVSKSTPACCYTK